MNSTTDTNKSTLPTRSAEFEELYLELIVEAEQALEEGNFGWNAILQEVLIPQVEAECLGMLAP